MTLTEELREYAYSIGFTKFGVTGMDRLQAFEEIIAPRSADYFPWNTSAPFLQSDPKQLYPEGKSIIILAYDYANVHFPEELTALAGKAYLSRCYKPLDTSICGARVNLFHRFAESKGLTCLPIANDLPLRRLGMQAGVCDFGKNNFAYVQGVGSFIILYGFVVDQVLDYDQPEKNSKCPENCRKCVDACPTGALCEPFHLLPNKCVGFLNWMKRMDSGRFSRTIPRELRSKLGSMVHGCDICQNVCPRNRQKAEGTFPKDAFLEFLKDHLTLEGMLRMDDGYYERYIYPVMYNYIDRKMIFQRNAAVAMGNSGDRKYIPALAEALNDPEECVRLHVAWSLGQLGGQEALQALKQRLETETAETVIEEIQLACAQIAAEAEPTRS